MAVTLCYLLAETAALPASAWREGWFAFMFVSLAGLAAIQIGFCLPAIRNRVSARTWAVALQAVIVLLCGGTAASVWLLMPRASAGFQTVLVIAYFWFAALNVMIGANRLTMAGSAAVLGSLATYTLTRLGGYALPIAGVCVLAVASLFVVRRLVRRFAQRAVAASRAGEDKIGTLEATPATLAAERPGIGTDADPRDLQQAAISAGPPLLTKRQAEILRLVAMGQSNKEIARALNVSPSTIKAHLSQAIAVLRAANRTDAAVRASTMSSFGTQADDAAS